MAIYGVSVPTTALKDPKTKEEFIVNSSDAAEWIKKGYVAVGGTVAKSGKTAATPDDEE